MASMAKLQVNFRQKPGTDSVQGHGAQKIMESMGPCGTYILGTYYVGNGTERNGYFRNGSISGTERLGPARIIPDMHVSSAAPNTETLCQN
jgi:hypothetical protein